MKRSASNTPQNQDKAGKIVKKEKLSRDASSVSNLIPGNGQNVYRYVGIDKYTIKDNEFFSISFNNSNVNLLGCKDQISYIINCGGKLENTRRSNFSFGKAIRDKLPSKKIKAIIISSPQLECFDLLPHVLYEDANLLKIADDITVGALILSGDPEQYAKHKLILRVIFSLLRSFETLQVYFTVLNMEASMLLRECNLPGLKKQLENWSTSGLVNDSENRYVEEYYFDFIKLSYMRNNDRFDPPFESFLKHEDSLALYFPVVNPSCKRVFNKYFESNDLAANNQTLVVLAAVETHKILYVSDAPVSVQKTVLNILSELKSHSLSDIVISHFGSEPNLDKNFYEHTSPAVVLLCSLTERYFLDEKVLRYFKELISLQQGEKHAVEFRPEVRVARKSFSGCLKDKQVVKNFFFTLDLDICLVLDKYSGCIQQLSRSSIVKDGDDINDDDDNDDGDDDDYICY